MRSLLDFQLDGRAALSAVLIESSYGDLSQAVAMLSVFPHPKTIAQTQARGVFSIVRCKASSERGQYTQLYSGQLAMLDDNKGPQDAFNWAHGWPKSCYKDLQLNHLWGKCSEPDDYTNLANLCVLPAFLAKLSDTHAETKNLLRYRSYDLTGYLPRDVSKIERPAKYSKMTWADPLPPVPNLEKKYLDAMRSKPKDRTTLSLYEVGWLFSGFKPVTSI